MKISGFMQKNVKTVRVWDDLNTAAQLMWDHDCGCLPVLDENSKVVAMLTDRDICMAAYTQGKPLREMQVRSAMSKEVFSCSILDTLAIAEKVMQTHRVRRLPVLDHEGRLLGLITLTDLAREAIRQKDVKGRDLTEQQVGTTLCRISEPRKVLEATRPAEPGPALEEAKPPRVARQSPSAVA